MGLKINIWKSRLSR